MDIRRKDIVIVNLDHVIGSEQGKTRPALVIQNDVGNIHSTTTIVAPITSRRFSKIYPFNVELRKEDSPLRYDSTILLNQIRTIDKERIAKVAGKIDNVIMASVEKAVKISLALS